MGRIVRKMMIIVKKGEGARGEGIGRMIKWQND